MGHHDGAFELLVWSELFGYTGDGLVEVSFGQRGFSGSGMGSGVEARGLCAPALSEHTAASRPTVAACSTSHGMVDDLQQAVNWGSPRSPTAPRAGRACGTARSGWRCQTWAVPRAGAWVCEQKRTNGKLPSRRAKTKLVWDVTRGGKVWIRGFRGDHGAEKGRRGKGAGAKGGATLPRPHHLARWDAGHRWIGGERGV